AEVLQLPDHLQVPVAAKAAVADAIVAATAEDADAERASGVRRDAPQENARHKWADALLTQSLQCRLHERLLSRKLGAIRQSDGDQAVDVLGRIDECHLQVRRIERLDESRRLEAQQSRQFGARSPPALACGMHRLAPPREFGPRAVDFESGHQARGELLGPL